ncbi:5'-nucleotidase [uncultured Capnocytophaga sp.]|uniref:5'-nucleotidase C-terminal domain-containing protein n=1 Tax=uncultured Capnocytophaga sp. TaxID=159273 RepID=UPI002591C9D4|nr:5'-nucleotidase [uncultured Capnocytophaga sp.]
MKKLKLFLCFIVLIVLCACATSMSQVLTLIKAKNIPIDENSPQEATIENFIAPYRQHVDNEMNKVLAQNAQDLVKDRNNPPLNAPITNFFADAVYETVAPYYKQRTGQTIDFVLLNFGGIRSDLPKGDITMGSAYNLMPFENEMVVLTMSGEKVQELADYLIKHRLPHPLSKQVQLQITHDGKITHFTIHGKPFNPKATYLVATSDYLMYGGDAMYFFSNPLKTDMLDYKVRNVLIDYFTKIDTLHAKQDNRFEYKP